MITATKQHNRKKNTQKKLYSVTVRLGEEANNSLHQMAKLNERSKSFYIRQAVEQLIEHNNWREEGIEKAIQELDEGKEIDGEKAFEWARSLPSKNPLPFPKYV